MSAWHDAVEVIESQITDLTNRNKELAPPPPPPAIPDAFHNSAMLTGKQKSRKLDFRLRFSNKIMSDLFRLARLEIWIFAKRIQVGICKWLRQKICGKIGKLRHELRTHTLAHFHCLSSYGDLNDAKHIRRFSFSIAHFYGKLESEHNC